MRRLDVCWRCIARSSDCESQTRFPTELGDTWTTCRNTCPVHRLVLARGPGGEAAFGGRTRWIATTDRCENVLPSMQMWMGAKRIRAIAEGRTCQGCASELCGVRTSSDRMGEAGDPRTRDARKRDLLHRPNTLCDLMSGRSSRCDSSRRLWTPTRLSPSPRVLFTVRSIPVETARPCRVPGSVLSSRRPASLRSDERSRCVPHSSGATLLQTFVTLWGRTPTPWNEGLLCTSLSTCHNGCNQGSVHQCCRPHPSGRETIWTRGTRTPSGRRWSSALHG